MHPWYFNRVNRIVNALVLVISSIVVTLTNTEFLQQLAKPQEVYGRVPTLAIFEGLCKVAKIGLNESSLGKVCDCP